MPVTSRVPRVPVKTTRKPLSRVSQGVHDLTVLLNKIALLESKLDTLFNLLTEEPEESSQPTQEWPSSTVEEGVTSIAK